MAFRHGARARWTLLGVALLALAPAPAGAATRRHTREAPVANCNDAFARCQRACETDQSDCLPACEGCPVEQSDDACRRSQERCRDDCDRSAKRCQLRCEDRFGPCVTD